MPVKTDSTNYQITSHEKILQKIDFEMKKCPLKIGMNVSEHTLIDSERIQQIKMFMDRNYSKIEYTNEFYNWYLKDAIIFEYIIDQEIVGYIIAKKKLYHVIDVFMNVMEISFFCIDGQWKHQHLGSYLLNLLIRYCIIKHQISIAVYSVIQPLKVEHFCERYIYHYPININTLYKNNFLTTGFQPPHVNTHISSVMTFNNFDKNLDNFYHIFVKKNFKMYKVHDLSLLNNPFYNFTFYENAKIIGYICIVPLKIHTNKNSYIQGLIYRYATAQNKQLQVFIQDACKYVKKHKLADVVSLYDDQLLHPPTMFLKGTCSTKFYMFNYTLHKNFQNHNTIFL